ncbi:methyltransferase domain-containing protein [Shewanella sp. YIC-542]|uniref:methyltransferase domain-containing protein n=1 Tax=Shewanella mytili TaxID=3377111 RepID=UPI00398E9258
MPVDAQQVAVRFAKAASGYQQHDCLQRRTSSLLLDGCTVNGGNWLDVGCGPGTEFARFHPAGVTAVDIAPAMLQQVRNRFPHYQTICTDAQKLALPSHMFDMVYSNLALQWCGELGSVIGELKRVLRPGGEVRIAMMVEVLPQLQTLGLSCHRFAGLAHIRQQFAAFPWQEIALEQQTIRCYFSELRDLLYSLKGVGASMAAPSQGLRGRSYWRGLAARAERLRTADGLPLDYHIVFITARS